MQASVVNGGRIAVECGDPATSAQQTRGKLQLIQVPH